MPVIIGRGFGRDDLIIQKVVGMDIGGTVTVETQIDGSVVVEEVPAGAVVVEDIPIAGSVVEENIIWGSVVLEQQIIGYLYEEGSDMSPEAYDLTMPLRNNRTFTVTANYKDADGNVTGPVDLAGVKIWMTAKINTDDPDSLAIFTKRNTAAGGSDAEITVLSPTTNGQMQIFVVPADTTNSVAGTYQYDVQLQLINTKTYTITKGKFILTSDVTKATT